MKDMYMFSQMWPGLEDAYDKGFGLAQVKEEGCMAMSDYYKDSDKKLPAIGDSKAVWIGDTRYTKEEYAKLRIQREPFFGEKI